MNGKTNIVLTTANLRAIGGQPTVGSDGLDGVIAINTKITHAAKPSALGYDFIAVVEHEIDEVLGSGTGLNGRKNGSSVADADILPEDLYRFDVAGQRSFNTELATQAYFSIDGGETKLARFNQEEGGDFSDWYSSGFQIPHVQDAAGTRGAWPTLDIELILLDVLGYHLNQQAADTLIQ